MSHHDEPKKRKTDQEKIAEISESLTQLIKSGAELAKAVCDIKDNVKRSWAKSQTS